MVLAAGDKLYTAEKGADRVQEFAVKAKGGEASFLFQGVLPDEEIPGVTASVQVTEHNGQVPENGRLAFNPADPDILKATITYTFSDGATMSWANPVFTETNKNSRVFRAGGCRGKQPDTGRGRAWRQSPPGWRSRPLADAPGQGHGGRVGV